MGDKKNYESDTLSQQRKAREEYLKLKRMQSGEIQTPPSQSHEMQVPLTFADKFKNFFFYYKWTVLAVIFTVVALFFLFRQCINRTDYDLIVTAYTSSPLGETDKNKMADYFENICEDVNGDGEIHICVYDCSYSEKNKQSHINANKKFQAILSTEYTAMLFITDDVTFSNIISTEGLTALFDTTFELDKNFYEFCESNDYFTLPENLKLSRRVTDDTMMQNNKTATACHDAAGRVIDKLK